MKTHMKIALVGVVLLFLLLLWVPWLDDQRIHDFVLRERGPIDGTIDQETGEVLCDYAVTWAPFGRWVASCEGGYFIPFFADVR